MLNYSVAELRLSKKRNPQITANSIESAKIFVFPSLFSNKGVITLYRNNAHIYHIAQPLFVKTTPLG